MQARFDPHRLAPLQPSGQLTWEAAWSRSKPPLTPSAASPNAKPAFAYDERTGVAARGSTREHHTRLWLADQRSPWAHTANDVVSPRHSDAPSSRYLRGHGDAPSRHRRGPLVPWRRSQHALFQVSQHKTIAAGAAWVIWRCIAFIKRSPGESAQRRCYFRSCSTQGALSSRRSPGESARHKCCCPSRST